MGETEKLVKAPENGQHMSLLAKLSSWFTGLKAEFNKIIWPDKQSLARQTGDRKSTRLNSSHAT